MIELHQFAPIAGLPNASPFCMKVETYLRLAGLKYDYVQLEDPRKAPKGKAPFIKDDGETIADSHFILAHLKQKYGDPLGDDLTDLDRAHHHALARMCEDHLLYALMYFRWMPPKNAAIVRDEFFAHMPTLLKPVIFSLVQRQQRKLLQAEGTSRHSEDEIAALAAEDIAVLATILGDKPAFGGDRPREIDCVTFPFLANIMHAGFEMPPRTAAESHPNLVAYRDRMMTSLFPEVAPLP